MHIILSGGIILAVFFISVYLGAFGHLQDEDELLSFKNAIASEVYSEDGEIIGRFFIQNRTNIRFEQIPSHLINAITATEDARFFDHRGIDPRSLLRVFFKTLLMKRRSSGGGSTITQQLAKNMYGRKDFGLLTLPVNKTKEAFLALRLEHLLGKEEILTMYINTVSFGENVYGVGAAVRKYFNKNVEDLKIEESAVLAGMLKANTYYNPRINPENAKRRRNVVLKQMERYNYLNPSEYDSLCALPLKQYSTGKEPAGVADYFLVQVRHETEKILEDIRLTGGKEWDAGKDGLTIVTTLNLSLQKYSLKAFHDHLSVMQNRLDEQYRSPSGKRLFKEITERELIRNGLKARSDNISYLEIFDWNGSYADSITVADSLAKALMLLHAGLLALDPSNGAVRSWVGGIDFRTQPYDQVLARRQLGSVFKPVLFAVALEEGLEPCYYLDNDSVTLSGFEDWNPENFDHSYGGRYSLAGALIHSMNIPTLSLFLKIGFEKLDTLWRKMGFSFSPVNNPSLALGTAEASIREVAAAYSSFANGGYKISPWCVAMIKSPEGEVIYKNDFNEPGAEKSILTNKTSMLISAMLQKALREGTGASFGNVYGINLPMAGKTGTSQNYADAWFAAFNPGLVIVCRAGASIPAVHFNNSSYGTGSALALPIVALTLSRVQSDHNLNSQYSIPFPILPPELQGALDCPDFRDKNFFEKIFYIFKKGRDIPFRKTDKSGQRKKPFLKKLFGR